MLARKNRGFSLLELMIVVIIAATLVNIALPSFTSLINSQERRGALHDLMGVFAFARQHAVMNGAIVTVCPLDTTGTCGRDWNSDIHAFLDPDNTRKLTANESLLRTISPSGNGRLIARSLNRSFFQFRPTGFIHSDLGNITWCPESRNASLAGQIIISRGGRVRIARDTDNDGIPEDSKGRPLRC
ncbi:MAG: GspH/FimT family pseudopilin [Marinobacter sp.]|uniref:GspH/FimT family pseudopilin n=1 Tax=Marinobacter sp. TaxID=50741 RepID=UPI001B6B68D3|nr:GspH/FimT family pseudopilin [Marinobacter sp.]MBQ0745836.1 GspH/FimT family pseudopilin [Marinobacter sp.]MBQ0814240.1 GspH/FimT family pseudopilin [Marinobacter sp.]|tara:strand:- start:6984 stop:7541 length:558 start_codon:yes stop_codon:yes gene_type:complete